MFKEHFQFYHRKWPFRVHVPLCSTWQVVRFCYIPSRHCISKAFW